MTLDPAAMPAITVILVGIYLMVRRAVAAVREPKGENRPIEEYILESFGGNDGK